MATRAISWAVAAEKEQHWPVLLTSLSPSPSLLLKLQRRPGVAENSSHLFTLPFVPPQNRGSGATKSVTLAHGCLWSAHDLGVQMSWIRLE